MTKKDAMIRMFALMVGLLLCSAPVSAEPPNKMRVGQTFLITRLNESSSTDSTGSKGSSTSRSAIVEQVIAHQGDGVVLEYDLPPEVSAEDRARTWQFPVRVLKPRKGPMTLLNRAELEARIEQWLKRWKIERAACGKWTFTWNAFKIECDPQSVLTGLEGFDVGPGDLREGSIYLEEAARAPALLKRSPTNAGALIATFEVDPDAVLQEQAQSDLVVAEIMGKPITLDAALRARATETVKGSITVSLESHSDRQVWRKVRTIELQTTKADGAVERETKVQTLERRRLP